MKNNTNRAIKIIEECLNQLKQLEKDEKEEQFIQETILNTIVIMNKDIQEIKKAII